MPNTQSTLLYKWFNEVWNDGDESAIDRLFHAEGRANDLTAADSPRGPEGFKAFYRDFKNQFSDVNVQVNEALKQDNFECAHCTVSATDRKSGKKVEFKGICMVRIVDEQIAEAWNNFDFLGLQFQLGNKLVPADAEESIA